MQLEKVVESWIAWCRENINPAEDLPITKSASELEAPWADYVDLFRYGLQATQSKLFDSLAKTQVANPSDLATRFPALHLYSSLLTCDPYPLHQDDISQARDDVREALAVLTGFLPVEDCRKEWRAIKFEILVSLALRKWDRARGLYELAEQSDLMPLPVVCALRAQLNFLIALRGHSEQEVFNNIEWEPRLIGRFDTDLPTSTVHASDNLPEAAFIDDVQALHLFVIGLQVERGKPKDTPFQQEALRFAVHDLERAFGGGFDLPAVYRCILARCYLELEDFGNAAKHFQALLLKENSLFAELDENLHLLLATSYRLAGKPDEATNVVDTWRTKHPTDHRAFVELSEVCAQQAKYEEAAAAYRRAVDLNPDLEADLGTRIALALSGIAGNAKLVDKIVRQVCSERPEVSRLINRMCNAYWPAFRQLSTSAQERWRAAILLAYYVPEQEKAARLDLERISIREFALAVEIELRTRIFDPFRSVTPRDTMLQKLAHDAKNQPGTKPFANFLLSKAPLTLGQMTTILKLSKDAGDRLLGFFRDWLLKNQPRIFQAVDALEAVLESRNSASHGGLVEAEVERVHSLCGTIATVLCGPNSHASPGF